MMKITDHKFFPTPMPGNQYGSTLYNTCFTCSNTWQAHERVAQLPTTETERPYFVQGCWYPDWLPS